MFLTGFFIIHLFVEVFPEKLFGLSFITPYSPHIKFQLYTLLLYALVITICIFFFRYPLFVRQKKNTKWIVFVFINFFIFLRIFAFQNSTFSNNHPDYGSFGGYYDNLAQAFYSNINLLSSPSFINLCNFFKGLWNNFYSGAGGAVYPFPSLLFCIPGLIMTALSMTIGYNGYNYNPFAEFGKFISPAFNLTYVLLLMYFARKYIFVTKERLPLYILFILLCFLPVHLFMGSALTYNLLADALLIASVSITFRFVQTWIELEKVYISSDYKKIPLNSMKPVISAVVTFSICFGLLLATKYIFHTVLFIIFLSYIILLFQYFYHNKKGRFSYFTMISFFVFSMVSCGITIYLILIARNFFHTPYEFISFEINSVIGNMGQLPSSLGIFHRLQILYQIIVIPNIGFINAFSGTLGMIFFTVSALKKRNFISIIVAIWSMLIILQTLSTLVMLDDHGGMTRNTLLLGLYVVYSIYFLILIVQWFQKRTKPKIYCIIKYTFIFIFCLEIMLAGTSAIIFFGNKSPRILSKNYFEKVSPEKTFTTIRHPQFWWYPFYHSSFKNYAHLDADYLMKKERFDLLIPDWNWDEFAVVDNADYWVISSHDAYFLPNHDKDLNDLRNSLIKSDYCFIKRFESHPLRAFPILDKIYSHYIRGITATSNTAGIWTPYYVEIYKK